MISDQITLLDPNVITIHRDRRQRTVVTTDDLEDSIRRNGVLHPVIITRDLVLVAGERRTNACKKLGIKVPARFFDTLSISEAKRVEIEENIKRKDLDWRERAKEINEYHQLMVQEHGKAWVQADTAKTIGMSQQTVSDQIRVITELTQEEIDRATTMEAAGNILKRRTERKSDNVMSLALEGLKDIAQEDEPPLSPLLDILIEPVPEYEPPIPPTDIITANFLEWAPTYDGPKFNLIHCDFPFGINVFAGQQMARALGTYSDSKEIYWELTGCLLANLDRLMAHYGHLVFWFAMQRYTETIRFFQKHAPGLEVNPYPLVWLKTDNVGVCPDPNKYQRRIYETALVFTRNGQKMVKVVSNAYASPTDKKLHPHCKPEPMLRHFFSGMVDSTTSLLDPTCGSGSALRAAEQLGASRILGLEIDSEHAENAAAALRHFRSLRAFTL